MSGSLHEELKQGGIKNISVVYGSVQFNLHVEEALKSLAESAFGIGCTWRSFDSSPKDRAYYILYKGEPIAMGLMPTFSLNNPYHTSYLGKEFEVALTANLTHFCVHVELRNRRIYGALLLESMLLDLLENKVGSIFFTTNIPDFYRKATPKGFELIEVKDGHIDFLEKNGRRNLLNRTDKVFYCIRPQ